MSNAKDRQEFVKFKDFAKSSNYEEGTHYLVEGTLYMNSDGSGTYYGNNGGTGYLNSDGSGTYYGEDDSVGYLNSDGSGTYYGGGGSTGYLNADGSASYYGENEDDEDSDEEYSIDSGGKSEDWSLKDDAIATALGVGMGAFMVHKQNKEKRRREEEIEERIQAERAKERRKKRFVFYREHWKGLLIAVMVIALIAAVGGFIWHYSTLIPMSVSPSDANNMTYKELEKELWQDGYIGVNGNMKNDLDYADLSREGEIIEITVDGNNSFKKGKRYPKDVDIDIKYHSAKLVKPPASGKELKGQQYKKVITAFKKAGFGNITSKGEKDSFIAKWMNDDGEVKSITIGGEKDYDKSTLYRVDEKIVIKYHKK